MITPSVPSGWKMVTLDDVAAPIPNAIVDGPFGSNLKLDDYRPEGVPVLQGKNITADTFRWSDVRFISNTKAAELGRSSVRTGDILIVKIGSIGYSAILDDLGGYDHAIIPANLAKVTPDLSKVDLRYLHRWLTSEAVKDYLVRVASKTAQPALSLGKIKNLPVPLPPIAEQRGIAEILDKVDALRSARRAALAQIDTLTRCIFLDMFGDPVTNPKGWPVLPIGKVVVDEVTTWNPTTRPDSSFKYIDIAAVDQSRKRIVADRELMGGEAPSRARQLVKTGDILVSTVRPNLNAVAIVPPRLDGATASTGFCILRSRVGQLSDEYLFALVRSESFISAMVRLATGASYPAVTDAIVRSWRAPIPPFPIQQEYARRVSASKVVQDQQDTSLEKMHTLFASLQYRAFRGEL